MRTVSLESGLAFWCHLNSLMILSTLVPCPRFLMAVTRILMIIGNGGVVWVVVVTTKDIVHGSFCPVIKKVELRD